MIASVGCIYQSLELTPVGDAPGTGDGQHTGGDATVGDAGDACDGSGDWGGDQSGAGDSGLGDSTGPGDAGAGDPGGGLADGGSPGDAVAGDPGGSLADGGNPGDVGGGLGDGGGLSGDGMGFGDADTGCSTTVSVDDKAWFESNTAVDACVTPSTTCHVVTFSIGSDGRVTLIDSDHFAPAEEACLEQLLENVCFPDRASGSIMPWLGC